MPLPEAELPEADWRARQTAHEARVDAWTVPVLDRASRGERHPVEDFLFTYYRHRPAQLRRWSPGLAVRLAPAPGAPEVPPVTTSAVARAGAALVLLRRTAGRPASYGCFGLHEWAMVHRSPDAVRHDLPLRLGAAGTDAVVEALPLRCTHLDAYRFFTPSAVPLNAVARTRETQADHEQPGCLHATMDLYKCSSQLSPWVASELVADCFDLARRVRLLDMRASPYDLTSLGHDPVRVETPEGRAAYAAAQRAFTAEAAPLRARLAAGAALVAAAADPALTAPAAMPGAP